MGALNDRPEDAVKATAEFWEWVRSSLSAYSGDTGAPSPVLPPWEALGTESQVKVYDTAGSVLGDMILGLLYIPEVDLRPILGDNFPGPSGPGAH